MKTLNPPISGYIGADIWLYWDSSDGDGGEAGYVSISDAGLDGVIGQTASEYTVIGLDPGDLVLGSDQTFYSTVTDFIETAVSANFEVSTGSLAANTDNFIPMFGASGADVLTGSGFSEFITGADGADILSGAGGADLIYGNRNSDSLFGNDGNDTIFGGQNDGPASSTGHWRNGTELISGGNGDDFLYGNFGADSIDGGAGADVIYGGQDEDTIWGDTGNDTIFGNLSNDLIVGWSGDDVLAGNGGYDAFGFYHNDGNDTITGAFEYASSSLRDLVFIQSNINGTGIASGSDVVSRISDNAQGQAVIDLGGGNSITFDSYSSAWFVSTDFYIF